MISASPFNKAQRQEPEANVSPGLMTFFSTFLFYIL